MPPLLALLLQMGIFSGGQVASSILFKKLLGGVASKVASKAAQTGAGRVVTAGLGKVAGAGAKLHPAVGRNIPNSAGNLLGRLGGGAQAVTGIAAGVGANELIFGGNEHPQPSVSDINPFQPMPGQANQQSVVSSLQEDGQLREVLDLMGVDLDELQSLMGSQQQRSII